jgi:hypothetical protein
MDDLLELDFAIPDEVLERAASAGQAYTLAYCTHPWHQCPWPQVGVRLNSRRALRPFGVWTLSNVENPNPLPLPASQPARSDS